MRHFDLSAIKLTINLYKKILQLTEEIELSLKNDSFSSLACLQQQRDELFNQLEVAAISEDPQECSILIKAIKKSEDRCLVMAKAMKSRIAGEMGATGRAKKLNNAYGKKIFQ